MNQTLIAADLDAIMPEVIATGLLSSLFTAQYPSEDLGGTGAQTGVYLDVIGLVDIACTSPPERFGDSGIKATEMKTMAEVAASEFHHVLLDSWYPLLYAGWRGGWRCLIDGTAYDVMGVESDSQKKMTRVAVRLVTV